MAQVSKLEKLHPRRKESIELKIYSICHFCEHSMFVDEFDSQYDSSEPTFEGCLLTERKRLAKDCSQFILDDEFLEEAEKKYDE